MTRGAWREIVTELDRAAPELFLLAGAADGELAKVVFTEADRQALHLPGLPLVVLQAVAEAADKIVDQTRAEHYHKLRDTERRRIDVEMGRACS
ncbi:hypothetical protein [Micromonospora sp. NPDC005189]|uniref:hypothetical protein n=1 Tax=unclassified Micromonospora TaxID=2617518 RepID=UPI0033BBD0F0